MVSPSHQPRGHLFFHCCFLDPVIQQMRRLCGRGHKLQSQSLQGLDISRRHDRLPGLPRHHVVDFCKYFPVLICPWFFLLILFFSLLLSCVIFSDLTPLFFPFFQAWMTRNVRDGRAYLKPQKPKPVDSSQNYHPGPNQEQSNFQGTSAYVPTQYPRYAADEAQYHQSQQPQHLPRY